MRRNGHKTTCGVKFDLKFGFSMPNFLYFEKFWKSDHDFIQGLNLAGSRRISDPVPPVWDPAPYFSDQAPKTGAGGHM